MRLTSVERVFEAMGRPADVTVAQVTRLIDEYTGAMLYNWNLPTDPVPPAVEQACIISVVRAIVKERETGLRQRPATVPIGRDCAYLLDIWTRPMDVTTA